MKVTISPGPIRGMVSAIPSKSHLHRLLICAALADGPTTLRCAPTQAEDITATINCLCALGAAVERRADGFAVSPIDRARLPEEAVFPCMESGSTLRFMLPIVCALGVRGRFDLSGRLPERPLAPLDEALTQQGIRLWRPNPDVLCCEGALTPGTYSLPGNISSQYITGLLLALPLLEGESTLRITGAVESRDYITMTTDACAQFGYDPWETEQDVYLLNKSWPFRSPGEVACDGDWSNAAFWLCAGAMPGGDIQLGGLSRQSLQGDREVCDILAQMGAQLSWEGGLLRVREGTRRAVEIDARATPDLVPVLCAVAAVSEGVTTVKNAARLRIKESDRIAATTQTLNALGANVREQPSGLVIEGVPRLRGGAVDAWGDHRIAMMAAVAATACEGPVSLTGAQAVRKSYPAFWEKLSALGGQVRIDE